MTYPIIQPPFTLQFRAMSKRELADYRAWFLGEIPVRVQFLEDAVRETHEFGAWRADFSPSSLDSLGEWYSTQVAVRERTHSEIEEIRSNLAMDVPIEEWDLSNRTYSLAMDIGMYLGEVMLRTHAGRLRWDQYLKSRRDADYGQVTINGTGVVSMNTVSFLIGIARSILGKTRTGSHLRETYDRWSGPDSALFLPPVPKRARKAD